MNRGLEFKEHAKEFRADAWEHLGHGGWGPSVLGYVGNLFICVLVVVGVLYACWAVFNAYNIRALFVENPHTLLGWQLMKIEDVETLTNVCKAVSLWCLFLLPIFYIFAVFRFGLAATALAVMRRGARWSHPFSGYGRGWRTVWAVALSDIYVGAGFLLLIVPGIRLWYSYRLVYLLRVDRPELPAEKVLKESRRLMDGRRWALFCLDVSFFWWYVLSVITKNLADVVVVPYHQTALAAFYEDLLDRDEAGAFSPEYETIQALAHQG